MQQLSIYFNFNIWEIVALSFFFIVFIIQILFYQVYYKKPLTYALHEDINEGASSLDRPMVSVIITSENEFENLSENLPSILEQDYPNFEVIVVNNGSTDESYELLQSLKLKYSNLYHTYVPSSNDKAFGRKKLALTLGIKAAKGDVLLFTEAYSKPISTHWIWEMTRNLTDDKDIVLGYSYYKETESFYNKIARFDNLIFSFRYILAAIHNKPFTGVYRNLAFRKNLFFDNKGFSSCLGVENGEELFINQIVNESNTTVVLSADSFVETNLTRYALWKQIKKTYSIAKNHFVGYTGKYQNLLEVSSRYLFYLLFLVLLCDAFAFKQWAIGCIALVLFLIRFFVQSRIVNKAARYFMSGEFGLSLIIIDFFQPFYNVFLREKESKLSPKKRRV